MVVQRLAARVQRWQLLGRYYANKWHYDGSKWAERVWYGERSSTAAVASVPFMITRSMRAQLEAAGFPAREVAALSPQAAHQLLADKLSYADYVARQQQQATAAAAKVVADAAARAAEAIAREDAASATETTTTTTTTLAVVPEAAEAATVEMPSAVVLQAATKET